MRKTLLSQLDSSEINHERPYWLRSLSRRRPSQAKPLVRKSYVELVVSFRHWDIGGHREWIAAPVFIKALKLWLAVGRTLQVIVGGVGLRRSASATFYTNGSGMLNGQTLVPPRVCTLLAMW